MHLNSPDIRPSISKSTPFAHQLEHLFSDIRNKKITTSAIRHLEKAGNDAYYKHQNGILVSILLRAFQPNNLRNMNALVLREQQNNKAL